MLYERDYRILTLEERKQLDDAEAFLAKKKIGWSVDDLNKYHAMHPRAGYFFKSLFPNNHLHKKDLENTEFHLKICNEFELLLDGTSVNERDILNFIRDNRAYSFIGSISQNFEFGHHGAYLFKEFKLATNYVCDYLVIGKNSHGYHFVFIELEKPSGDITIKNGEFGTTVRNGIKQVEDWDEWINANFHFLRTEFEKYLKPGDSLPKEFTVLDKSRINFVVIAGRRKDFQEKTYLKKRKLSQQMNINLLHYDNLVDLYKMAIKAENY